MAELVTCIYSLEPVENCTTPISCCDYHLEAVTWCQMLTSLTCSLPPSRLLFVYVSSARFDFLRQQKGEHNTVCKQSAWKVQIFPKCLKHNQPPSLLADKHASSQNCKLFANHNAWLGPRRQMRSAFAHYAPLINSTLIHSRKSPTLLTKSRQIKDSPK